MQLDIFQFILALILIGLGLALDLFSSFLGIKGIFKDKVPSGVPVIPFILYIMGIIALRAPMLNSLVLIVLSLLVHIFFNWFLVYIVSKFYKKNDKF